MLELAGLEVAAVCGDGNCGYYASMASGSEDAVQHCRRGKRMTAPTAADYEGQQALRDRCVDWLLHSTQQEMLAIAQYHRGEIAQQRNGKKRARDGMGVYPNSAALRAMAAVDGVHLVVVTDNTGPSIRAPRHKYPMLGSARPGRPYDRVSVYPPDGTALLPRFKSWANDIVPVLLRHAAGEQKRTDPTYRVITFNGEPPGSLAGHFEATRKQI